MLLVGACSSNDAPETLPLIEDAPATAAEPTTTTVADELVEPGVDSAVAELSAEQQAMLDTCADALTAAAEGADATSPTYSDDVSAILMDPASGALESCGGLFDPAVGIDQGVVISFMIETLPPELLGTLSVLASSVGPDGTPIMPGADPAPAADVASDTGADGGAASGDEQVDTLD